ncbi:hypothetical protein LY78DRAFT_409776 [Colletotrichum sublineola]|nr:hypothetical protein LY78DRAFT_409776 [Colletotrichum sublineola]
MKTLIIKAFTIALVNSTAEACAQNIRCRCINADGSRNDTATEVAASYLKNAFIFPDKNNVINLGKIVPTLNNCDVRKACVEAGATGNDSLCEHRIRIPG